MYVQLRISAVIFPPSDKAFHLQGSVGWKMGKEYFWNDVLQLESTFPLLLDLVYMCILFFVEVQKYQNPQGGCEYITSKVLWGGVKRFNSTFPLTVNGGLHGNRIKEKQTKSIPRRHGNKKPLDYIRLLTQGSKLHAVPTNKEGNSTILQQ
jgi:hypothetical protein